MSGEDAGAVLDARGRVASKVRFETVSIPEIIAVGVEWEDFAGWTAGAVRRALDRMAAIRESNPIAS